MYSVYPIHPALYHYKVNNSVWITAHTKSYERRKRNTYKKIAAGKLYITQSTELVGKVDIGIYINTYIYVCCAIFVKLRCILLIDKHNIYKWLTFRHVYLITNDCFIHTRYISPLARQHGMAFTSVNVASVLVWYLKSVSLKSLYGFTPIVLEMQIMHINYSQWAVVCRWRHDWSNNVLFSFIYIRKATNQTCVHRSVWVLNVW